jgi:hypothetical protein
VSRLEDLRELAEHLKVLVFAEHTEHGLQGVSGLVGQYQKCLTDIETLEAKQPAAKGTVLDELTQRRAVKKPAARPARAARRAQ